MAAPKGNNYAEKVTLEDARTLVELALSKVNNDCYFLSSVADACGTYRDKFDYLLKKFNNDEQVFRTIKRMRNKCETIVAEKTANGEINTALGIFILKSYHGLMETSKVQQETQSTVINVELTNDQRKAILKDLEDEL